MLQIVALIAVGNQAFDGSKITFVVVLVAVGTVIEWYWLRIIARCVTIGARYLLVLAFERKMSEAVIKPVSDPQLAPAVYRVAIGTGNSEAPIVLIFVAVGAIRKGNPSEFLKRLTIAPGFAVAFNVIYLGVLALELKRRLSVIEILSPFESVKAVARNTIFGEGSPMLIGMAGQTRFLQSNERFAALSDLFIRDIRQYGNRDTRCARALPRAYSRSSRVQTPLHRTE